ncbi:hypothetical protein FKM82_020042 [Ascaphus truei]
MPLMPVLSPQRITAPAVGIQVYPDTTIAHRPSSSVHYSTPGSFDSDSESQAVAQEANMTWNTNPRHPPVPDRYPRLYGQTPKQVEGAPIMYVTSPPSW